MNCKLILSGPDLVEIERHRYDELVAQEEELRLLKNALGEALLHSEIVAIKKIFNITPVNKETTESEEK